MHFPLRIATIPNLVDNALARYTTASKSAAAFSRLDRSDHTMGLCALRLRDLGETNLSTQTQSSPQIQWDGTTWSVRLLVLEGNVLEASWKPAQTYVVRIRESGTEAWRIGFETPLTHFSFVDLTPDTEYEMQVSARNAAGEGKPKLIHIRTPVRSRTSVASTLSRVSSSACSQLSGSSAGAPAASSTARCTASRSRACFSIAFANPSAPAGSGSHARQASGAVRASAWASANGG